MNVLTPEHAHSLIRDCTATTSTRGAKALLLVAVLVLCASSRAAPQTIADEIVIVKSQRTLTLMHDGKALKGYKVALGTEPIGAKERIGDHKTPEGEYTIDAKKDKSQFYKALHLSYPNTADRARARRLGIAPGGDIEIHGLGAKFGWIGSARRKFDWTDGCIAVTNQEIDEIFAMVPVGTRVEIRP